MDPTTWIASSLKGKQLPANLQEKYFKDRYDLLAKYADHIVDMLSEPNFIDDMFRIPVADYLKYLVLSCETLLVQDDQEGVMGAAVFSDVLPGRHAEFGGYIVPAFREGASIPRLRAVRKAMHEDVLDYAWNDLKLVKLTSRVAKINKSAIRLLENLGFRRVGELRYEMQLSGSLVDMFLYELINPTYTEILNGFRTKNNRTKLPAVAVQHDEPVKSGHQFASRIDTERTPSDERPRYRQVSVEEQLAFADGSEDDE
ncbi:MAG TPA: N-acetyltransferase [Candidatus Melainabacteria bacterium]|nr:N-acetyltransferase [Candidatus Melainabacteria bacterium]HIN66153.1 N-acetyltransferase [Candidatus Obscuribacterales bacterium]